MRTLQHPKGACSANLSYRVMNSPKCCRGSRPSCQLPQLNSEGNRYPKTRSMSVPSFSSCPRIGFDMSVGTSSAPPTWGLLSGLTQLALIFKVVVNDCLQPSIRIRLEGAELPASSCFRSFACKPWNDPFFGVRQTPYIQPAPGAPLQGLPSLLDCHIRHCRYSVVVCELQPQHKLCSSIVSNGSLFRAPGRLQVFSAKGCGRST